MHGVAGSRRRRSIIRAEFVLSAVVGAGLGLWVAVAATTVGLRFFGAWMVGMGVNYGALAWQAVQLSRPGALEAELAGVDVARELRRYSVLQFWIVVPLLLAVLAISSREKTRANEQR